jgi:hypothetical protein
VAPRHIFFYGTLMRGFALRERAGIEPWVRFAGCGAVRLSAPRRGRREPCGVTLL